MENKNIELFPIHRVWILSIFLVIPFVLAVGLWDHFFNNSGLLPYLGISTIFLPLYVLVFETPHIIASFIGFVDKEYVRHYRRHLVLGIPLMAISFLCLVWFNFTIAVSVYLAVTTYHVIRQQTGIALMFGILKSKWHSYWSWFLVINATIVYASLMLPDIIIGLIPSFIFILVVTTLVLMLVCSGGLIHQTDSRQGIWYIILTMAMVATGYLMLWFGYIFLAVFVVRFVHDITAFLFYITHEVNRNKEQIKNSLYKVVPLMPFSLIIIVPLFAIFIGLLLRESIPGVENTFVVLMLFGFTHYYLESIMWKSSSPHRQQVKVV
jgi:hypothetical protein